MAMPMPPDCPLDPLSCDDDTPLAGGPGWGLTADEIAANVRDWREDLAAEGLGPWPSDAEIAEYEANQKRNQQGRSR